MLGAAALFAAASLAAPAGTLHAQAPTDAAQVESIIAALADENFRVRRQAARRAAALGPAAAPAVPALAAAYDSDDQTTRTWVMRAFAAIGPGAAQGVPAMVAALESDPVRTIRQEAAVALGAVGVVTPEVVAALARAAAEETNGSNRAAALETLGTLGGGAAAAFPVMHAALRDRLYYVRQAAAGALGAIGPAALDALPALEEVAAGDAVVRVRRTAAESIEKLRAAEAAAVADPSAPAESPDAGAAMDPDPDPDPAGAAAAPAPRPGAPPTDITGHPVPETDENPDVRPGGLDTPEILRPDPADDDGYARQCGAPTLVQVSQGTIRSLPGQFAGSADVRCFRVEFPDRSGSHIASHAPWLLSVRLDQDVRDVYVMDVLWPPGSPQEPFQPVTDCATQARPEDVTVWEWDDRHALDQMSDGRLWRRCPYPNAVLVRLKRAHPNYVAQYNLVLAAPSLP